MKNTIKTSAIIIFIASVLFSPISQANAGILDWFKAKNDTQYGLSVNYLYTSDPLLIINFDSKNFDSDVISLVQKNSIIQTSSTAKTIEKKTSY